MNRLLRIIASIVVAATASVAYGQIVNPVDWSWKLSMDNATEGKVVFTAKIDNGWHIYSTNVPEGGPHATNITFANIDGARLVDGLVESRKPVEKFDDMFSLNIGTWEGEVSFTQKFVLTDGNTGCSLSGKIEAMACNSGSCTPPKTVPFEVTYNYTPTSSSDTLSDESDTDSTPLPTTGSESNDPASAAVEQWWAPVTFHDAEPSSIWYILLWGFISGLVALLTPCVWPMIPLTVSFFLKKGQNRRRAIADAIIYGLAIVVIFLILGIVITLAFGAGKLNELATNAVFNIIFFALLVVFAISFFGAFEIKLPASWSTKMDAKAERTTGIISIFFMAFTLTLVSFSCTGPLVGTLLVETASQDSLLAPMLGMGAFALALAIPFALLALFPSLINGMRGSNSWLGSVKVVLGFLELILSLKFLSVVDLAYGWGILDREIFIALWIVLFVMLGMYLVGKLKFAHDAELTHVSLTRFFLALASWSFAVYLLPGMWGAPLKGVSAFLPPLDTQDFNLYETPQYRHFDDFEEGMTYAQENGMPVLIDFSGFGCVNCRKMEGAVLDNDRVKGLIENNYVFITLMVDDRTPLLAPITVEENGKKITLENIGEKWSYLQRYKFEASVQPYYVQLNNDGQSLTSAPYGFDENVDNFIDWLESGLAKYEESK